MTGWDTFVQAGLAVISGGLTVVGEATASTPNTETSSMSSAISDQQRKQLLAELNALRQQEQAVEAELGIQGGAALDPPPSNGSSGSPCCRFELSAPFLLDNQTGRVYRYDETARAFAIVEIERPIAQAAFEKLAQARALIRMRSALDSDSLLANELEYEALSPFVADQRRAIDEQLKKLRQSGKP